MAAITGLGLDLILRIDQQHQQLQLIDAADDSRVIQEHDLDSPAPFQTSGTAAGDKLVIDFLAPFIYEGGIEFDAGGGRDEVLLSTNALDELVLVDGHTSSNSFIAQFGANQFSTTGLELFEQQGAIQTTRLFGTEQADAWTVSGQNQQLEVRGLGGVTTVILLEPPSNQLSLDSQGGDDYISIFDVQLNVVDLTIDGGTGGDTIELTHVQAERSDLIVSGDAGADTLLMDQNEFSRSNVSLLGGMGDDALLVTGSTFGRCDLLMEGGLGHTIKIDFDSNLMSRSDLIVMGGTADLIPEFAADLDLDGDVDLEDYHKWKSDFGQNAESDANGDGVVNAADYTVWRRRARR